MYKIKNKLIILFIAIIMNLFTGCGTTQNIDIPDISKPIPKDKSIIELERPSSLVGAARSPYVYVNNTLIGELGNGGKLTWLTNMDNQLECIHLEHDRLPVIVDQIIWDEKPVKYQCFTIKAAEINKLELDYIRGRIIKKLNQKELVDTFEISKVENISKINTEHDVLSLLKNAVINQLGNKVITTDASKLVELYIEEYQEGNAGKRWLAVTKEGSTLLKVKVIIKKDNEIVDTYITRHAIVEGGFLTVGADKLIFDDIGKDIADYLIGK